MSNTRFISTTLPHVISIVILLGLIALYFGPQLSGKTIAGGDVVSSTAWSKQVIDYKEETGESSNWNPSMFSGMPWGLLTAGHQYNVVKHLDKAGRLFIPAPMGIVIKGALLCYLSFLLLGFRPYLSLLGTLGFVFSVYYFVMLEAGHQSKLAVLTNFPLLLAGLLLCYRDKWKIGMPAIAIATSLAIANNHIQMLYYLLLCFIVFSIPYLVDAFKQKKVPAFAKFASLALLAAIIGALSNFSVLTSAKAFADDTMRGKPILENTSTTSSSNSSSTTSGLDWNYAMQWSHELKDLGAIIIPRFVGGSSAEEVSSKSPAGQLLRQNNAERGSDNTYRAPMYWGNLIFTSGPSYCGVAFVALSLFGFFVIPGKLKWALLSSTIFILLLSMGKHVSWLNHTLFDIAPLFNKFRAPSSAISLLPLLLSFSAIFGLNTILKSKKKKKFIKPLIYSIGGLSALILVIALAGPALFSFESSGDARYSPEVSKIFVETRQQIFRQDAWRSLLLSLLAFGIVYAYLKRYYKKAVYLLLGLSFLVIFDLWTVNLRHLDSDNWESKKEYQDNFALRQADQQILAAETNGRGYYRVLDIPNLQSAVGSYYHNTIGGYHAAKLQRYQDLIDYHILVNGQLSPNQGVLNMLNAKYIIDSQQNLQRNPNALGNAWCVNEVKFVNSTNQEIESLSSIDPSSTAIIHQNEFPQAINNVKTGSGQCEVKLTEYKPNRLTYSFKSDTDQFVVFSEVWYDQKKGMRAYIDGNEVDHYRVNYVLRGLQVPSGTHEIVYKFEPVIKGASISILGSILTFALLLFGLFNYFKPRLKS